MSWDYLDEDLKRCTFSLDVAAASGQTSCSAIFPSVLSKLIPSEDGYCFSGSEMARGHDFPYGTMCAHSTHIHGAATSKRSAAVFPAPTYQPQAKAQESTERKADSGERWRESFAEYDPDLCVWRTRQISLIGGLAEFSETWPDWGTMQNGACSEVPTSGHPILGIASGFRLNFPDPRRLPTPAASDWKGQFTMATIRKRAYRSGVRLPEELCRRLGVAIIPSPEFWEWMMGWPIGSSGLLPLEMGRFQLWRQQHGLGSESSLRKINNAA